MGHNNNNIIYDNNGTKVKIIDILLSDILWYKEQDRRVQRKRERNENSWTFWKNFMKMPLRMIVLPFLFIW